MTCPRSQRDLIPAQVVCHHSRHSPGSFFLKSSVLIPGLLVSLHGCILCYQRILDCLLFQEELIVISFELFHAGEYLPSALFYESKFVNINSFFNINF